MIKKFKGIMKIHCWLFDDEEIEGEWVYRPQYNDWYDGQCAYPASRCEIVTIYE